MMKKSEIQKMAEFESFYWWHIGRQKIIEKLLWKYLKKGDQNKILDVGCGTGANFKVLSKFGDVEGVDNKKEALDFCQSKGFKNVFLDNARHLNFQDESFNLLTAFDLLEHLEDDEKALSEFHRVLKKDGFLFILVPACPFLWSEHDEALGHQRRYSKSELEKKLKKVGFKIIKKSYAIFFLFLPILIYRLFRKSYQKFRKNKEPKNSYVILPFLFNSLFIKILYLESYLLSLLNLPFGSSLVFLAKK